jgi:hypothetical protein
MLDTFGAIGRPISVPGEERRSPRISAALPVMIATARRDHPALLADITPEGAKVECSETLPVGTLITLKSGSIRAAAIVIWGEGIHYGLEFDPPLGEAEIDEHVRRSDAMVTYNKAKAAS